MCVVSWTHHCQLLLLKLELSSQWWVYTKEKSGTVLFPQIHFCVELVYRYESDHVRNESEDRSNSSATYTHNTVKVFSHNMISPSIIRTALPPFRLAAFTTSKAFLTATVTSYHTRQLSTSSLCRNSLSAKQSHQEATSPHKRMPF